jgi:hypothetical protein
MTRPRQQSDDDDDRDPEEPEDFDRDDSDPYGTDTEPCPVCKREVHELTDICPHCGNFIVRDEQRRPGNLWLISSVVVLLVILGLILFSGRF